MFGLFQLIGHFIDLYTYLLLFRVLLTWFPNIDWYREPYRTLESVTEPVLRIFRFIPPIGMLDISPMVAIFVLNLIARVFLSIG